MYSRSKGAWIGKAIIFGVLIVTLLGLVTQFLWNYVMPGIFGLPVITFWQGIAMFLLAKIIFGFGGKGGSHGWGGYRNHQWRKQWAERYSKLSPDERERFKQKMKDKWCSWEQSSANQTETEPKV